VADLIAVGSRAGGSLAHFVFGVAAAGLDGKPGDAGTEYPLRVRLVALDDQDRAVGGLDTSLVIRLPAPLEAGEFLVGRTELTLPPGRWSYRASVQQGDSAGVVLPRDSVHVASSEGASLSLSDIALGSRGRAVRWIASASDTVFLAPSALFRLGRDVELYYEASGAVPGRGYRHEITVLRPEARGPDKRRPLVALAFEEEAPAPVLRSHRTVRLDGLKEGGYLVEVKITSPTGEIQIRRRPITLAK
jgi:hypothetical protein